MNPVRWLRSALILLPVLLPAMAEAQEAGEAEATGSVFGRILDQDTFQPVAGVVVRITVPDGVLQDISGPSGTFLIDDVPVGERVVVMEHIAYGEYAQHVGVETGRDLRIEAYMSPRAIQFQPLVVEALSEVERRRLTSGFSVNEIPAEEIEQAAQTGQHLGDLLRGGVSGIRVRGGIRPGDDLCVEYRGSGAGVCDEVAVYLDGVAVAEPGQIYASLSLDDIDRVEVLSPLEAVVRFGDRGARGALLIESRVPSLPERQNPFRTSPTRGWDWSLEEEPHPSAKVFGNTILANALGVGLGYLALRQCVGTVATDQGTRFDTQCGALTTMGTGVFALSLPGAVGGIAATRSGSTRRSRGRIFHVAMAGLISTTAGYVMLMHGEDPEYRNNGLRIGGLLTMTVGTPLLLTISDRFFRSLR
ncbi:MAG: TonB-dependent receptor plug domain-containing protein [Gammaproteobacteria bacterium]|nr:TonB-dependent receptor plug domain-containing protein [Gammaproteobacteria bacterium]